MRHIEKEDKIFLFLKYKKFHRDKESFEFEVRNKYLFAVKTRKFEFSQILDKSKFHKKKFFKIKL